MAWYFDVLTHYRFDMFYFYVQDAFVSEKSEDSESGPLVMNAFEMITLSQGLNLSALFDRRQVQWLI